MELRRAMTATSAAVPESQFLLEDQGLPQVAQQVVEQVPSLDAVQVQVTTDAVAVGGYHYYCLNQE